jgi:AcrR family transcriptional regulator
VTSPTVDWAARRHDGAGAPAGVRERKKQQLRQRLSDTATELFLQRGFDAVRVSEIAARCGVSEKTVFNHFPTKESLVLDRWESSEPALRSALASSATPVTAVREVLAGELAGLVEWMRSRPDAADLLRRFTDLVAATPSLRAHERDSLDRLVSVAADELGRRARRPADDPVPRIAAVALIGLWDVQSRSLTRHLAAGRSPADLRRAVTRDVTRAARQLESGLASYPDRRAQARVSSVSGA